jgi:hypothetical protein
MARVKAPEVGHLWKQCVICGKNFRKFRSQIRRSGEGRFCGIPCRNVAWHLFSEALATEKLEPLLNELARLWGMKGRSP